MDIIILIVQFNKVKVCLVLGHTATRREEITSNEKTHDWKFYVKGEPGAKVECFIDRVIFTLHDSFPNPVQSMCLYCLITGTCIDFTGNLTK